jgi:hypothetical protein
MLSPVCLPLRVMHVIYLSKYDYLDCRTILCVAVTYISGAFHLPCKVNKMLGELIYEGKGKMIGMRVLDDNGTMETTIDCRERTSTRRNWILRRVWNDAD